MKKYFLLIVIAAIGTFLFTACENAQKEENALSDNSPTIPFEGLWIRTFQLGQDSLQYVTYDISNDSIQYIMEGPLPINYTMQIDTFISNDNRLVTKLNDVYYVIFIKDFNADSLSLFKQQMEDRNEALTRDFPADTVSGHFSSWYTYYLKK